MVFLHSVEKIPYLTIGPETTYLDWGFAKFRVSRSTVVCAGKVHTYWTSVMAELICQLP